MLNNVILVTVNVFGKSPMSFFPAWDRLFQQLWRFIKAGVRLLWYSAMQLVHLFLPVLFLIAVQALSFEERRAALKERLQVVKDRLKTRIGNATEQTKKKMARGMDGIDLEARKARLERLQKRAKALGEKVDLKLKERLAKIQPVETERINEDEPVNLYEVNAMQGVDSYMFQSDMHLTEFVHDSF